MSLQARVALAAEAGFEGYELIVARSDEAELHVDCSDSELARIRDMVTGQGLEICSMFGSPVTNLYPITSPEDQVWEQGIRAVERMLYIAQQLGTDALLLVPGRVNESIRYDIAYDRALEALRQLAPVAEERGVVIAIENVGNRFLLSPLEMRDFIDQVGHPYLRGYFDIGNAFLLRSAPPEQWIQILGGRLRRLHAKDGRIFGRTLANVMLLAGEVDWQSVMHACRAVGYDGYMTAEVGAYPRYPQKGIRDISSALDIIFAGAK
jgi:hexulose-6-phosphate isomerase